MDSLKPGSQVFSQLTELLRERIGLNPESVGKQTLEHAVEHRLRALKLTNASVYVTRLTTDAAEWSEFLEEIIVPESWFFRELTPFKCAREFAREKMSQANRPRVLRFLSIPCSRGEEPYSLAMTLMDAGLLPVQFEILACDLSERSLEFARRGQYRGIAFRETDPTSERLRRQYFQPLNDQWELQASIRTRVRFQQANLAKPESFVRLGQFDFVFCRNVLIYLTEEVRQRTLTSFRRMLLPGGILYLGHSECRLGPQAGAMVWNQQFPAAFTWPPLQSSPASLLTRTATTNKLAATKVVQPAISPARMPASPEPIKHKVATVTPAECAANSTPAVAESLSRAKELANCGQLNEAESLCQVMIQRQPTCADVYCLLGVIVQARGDLALAETHYHKSLFLEPDHIESLTHVLRLAQLRGDTKHIMNYQRRLARLRPQGT